MGRLIIWDLSLKKELKNKRLERSQLRVEKWDTKNESLSLGWKKITEPRKRGKHDSEELVKSLCQAGGKVLDDSVTWFM